jgi:hypothetical protein
MHSLGDDPRQIREHLVRSRELANTHGLPCMVVGLAGAADDLMTPEFLNYVESALRVEDAIFRMTRERAVLFLADADRDKAQAIVERLLREFGSEFPTVDPPRPGLGYFAVQPGCSELLVKEVLPAVFPPLSRSRRTH